MSADFGQVERILALMREDERLGWVIEGQFGSFCEQTRLASFLSKEDDSANSSRLRQSHGRLRPLFDDEMLLFGILLRTALDFERRTENKLDEGFFASPAVAGKSLILRTKTHLYRIEKPGAAGGVMS